MKTFNEQLQTMEENEKWLSDVATILEGNYTIHLESRDIVSFNTKQEIIEISKEGKIGLMTKDCKIIVPTIYDGIRSYSIESRTIIFEKIIGHKQFEKKVGVATFSGDILLEAKYDEITYIDNKRYIVRLNYQYAVINQEGNLIVDFGKYDYIDYFVHGLSRVKKGNKWGIINKYGYEFLSPKFDEIWKLKDEMSTTKVIFQGEEFYLCIDKCPSGIRGTMEDYMRMSEIQILFKYKNQKYKKLEYPEIDVYDLEEERRRKIEEERKEREWQEVVESMTLDAFEGDEDLYNDWLNSH